MSRNFLNAFIGDSRFPGIKLPDRSARRFGIEVTSRGGPASACLHVVRGGCYGRVPEAVCASGENRSGVGEVVFSADQVAFRAFGLDPAQRWGDRLAFGFLHPGIAVVDGMLPVGGMDGSEVSRGSFGPQGCVQGTGGGAAWAVTPGYIAMIPGSGIRVVGSRLGAAGVAGLAGWI